MNISVVGVGYVGLVTGVCFAEVGHHVTCIDINTQKIQQLTKGISPIFEPGLEDYIRRNLHKQRLFFTTDYSFGLKHADVIMIAVGTPSLDDGKVDLSYVQDAALSIAKHLDHYAVIVVKSTVPVGTNEWVRDIIKQNIMHEVDFDIASNPEFLREGSAIYDVFHADRIVIGVDSERAASILRELHAPFGAPIVETDIKSAELIKYASNAFLATKISFINEIANLCDKIGANIDDVAFGMGLDKRIGPSFLRAGIGYGGSCFPKDTKALVQIAGNVEHDFRLLKSVIEVNIQQQELLVKKAIEYFGSLKGKKITVLGLSFKPNTDDIREAASLVIIRRLLDEGAFVTVYDPVAMLNAKQLLNKAVKYGSSVLEAVEGADCVFVVTEWEEFRTMDLSEVKKKMKQPVIFDGRNCMDLEAIKLNGFDYISIGRPPIMRVSSSSEV